jgi:hypothetical protein
VSFYSLPAGYDSQFHCPEPEGMLGVMGSDPNRCEFVPREPVVMPETDNARAFTQRLLNTKSVTL